MIPRPSESDDHDVGNYKNNDQLMMDQDCLPEVPLSSGDCLWIDSEPCCRVSELHLRQNNIGDDGVEVLAKCLGGDFVACTKLEFLDLSANRIGNEGAESLGRVLRRGKTAGEKGGTSSRSTSSRSMFSENMLRELVLAENSGIVSPEVVRKLTDANLECKVRLWEDK
eukprot:g15997.t1